MGVTRQERCGEERCVTADKLNRKYYDSITGQNHLSMGRNIQENSSEDKCHTFIAYSCAKKEKNQ